MAKDNELKALGFSHCAARPRCTNIMHPDPWGLGPFCRLLVEDNAPERPGVYAWLVDGEMKYVGKSRCLRQITQGVRMDRAAYDTTYIAPSQALDRSSPRVWVNGRLNSSLEVELDVSWWWLETGSEIAALRLEARLINEWKPPWNRAWPGFNSWLTGWTEEGEANCA